MTQAPRKAGIFLGLFVLAEIGLYFTYRHHDARFHWFLHFFVGASAALWALSLRAWRTRRVPRRPLLWILAFHVLAMLPDFLFLFFGVIHYAWMDLFLWHIAAHFVPGRNWTWYAVFLASLALYLRVLRRRSTVGEI